MTRRAILLAASLISAALGLVAACVGDDPQTATTGTEAGLEAGGEGGGGGVCPSGQKLCVGKCVPTDTAHGCAGLSCEACPVAKNWSSECAADGKCQCAGGFGNCDGDPDNGCERSLTGDTNNCGACKNTCGASGTSAAPGCDGGTCQFQCSPGRAHCGKSDVSGCETALADDPKNCGYCGHDCLGGLCAGGACQAVLLSSDGNNVENLYGLVRVATSLYVTNNCHGAEGYVFQTSTAALPDGGASPPNWIVKNTFDAGQQDCVAYLAVDNTGRLFFTIDQSGVWSVKTDGTGVTRLAAVGSGFSTLAVDQANAYWVDYSQPNGTISYRVKDGSMPVVNTRLDTTGVSMMLPDTVGAQSYLFTARGSGVWVQTIALGVLGTLGTRLDQGVDAGPGNTPTALAIADGYLYWGAGSKIYRLLESNLSGVPEDVTPKDAMNQKLLPSSVSSFPAGLMVVDKTTLYFAHDFGSSAEIWRMKRNGTTPAELMATIAFPTGAVVNTLAQDDAALYFTVGNSLPVQSAVYKLAK